MKLTVTLFILLFASKLQADPLPALEVKIACTPGACLSITEDFTREFELNTEIKIKKREVTALEALMLVEEKKVDLSMAVISIKEWLSLVKNQKSFARFDITQLGRESMQIYAHEKVEINELTKLELKKMLLGGSDYQLVTSKSLDLIKYVLKKEVLSGEELKAKEVTFDNIHEALEFVERTNGTLIIASRNISLKKYKLKTIKSPLVTRSIMGLSEFDKSYPLKEFLRAFKNYQASDLSD